jgi:hypothetical protein
MFMQFKKLFFVLVVGLWGVESYGSSQFFLRSLCSSIPNHPIRCAKDINFGELENNELEEMFLPYINSCGEDIPFVILYAGRILFERDDKGYWENNYNDFCSDSQTTLGRKLMTALHIIPQSKLFYERLRLQEVADLPNQ